MAKAKADALAAYRGYWRTRTTAMATADLNDTRVDKYVIDDAGADLFGTLMRMNRDGKITVGKPGSHPTVTAVALNKPPSKPSTVTIHDCLNMSQVKTLNAKSRKPTGRQESATPYVANATVRTVGKDWRVEKLTFQPGEPC